jgi:hypothetical protein
MRKWYFGEHAVTSFYFLSTTLLLNIVKWPFWIALGTPLQGATAYTLSLIFFAIALPYLWVTLRQLHGEGHGKQLPSQCWCMVGSVNDHSHNGSKLLTGHCAHSSGALISEAFAGC